MFGLPAGWQPQFGMQMSVRPGGLWNPGTQSAKTMWPGGGGGGSVVDVVEAGAAAVVVVARGAALGESEVPRVQAVITIASMSRPSCRLMIHWTTTGDPAVPRAAGEGRRASAMPSVGTIGATVKAIGDAVSDLDAVYETPDVSTGGPRSPLKHIFCRR